MQATRRRIAVLTLALVVCAVTAGQTPATASSPATGRMSGASCHPGDFRSRIAVPHGSRTPVITHRTDVTVASGSRRPLTIEAPAQVVLFSEVAVGHRTVGQHRGDRVLRLASRRVRLPLAADGRNTDPRAQRVHGETARHQPRTETYVVYVGGYRASGTWRSSSCHGTAGSPGRVSWAAGSWHSWGPQAAGIIACASARPADPVALLARREGCG